MVQRGWDSETSQEWARRSEGRKPRVHPKDTIIRLESQPSGASAAWVLREREGPEDKGGRVLSMPGSTLGLIVPWGGSPTSECLSHPLASGQV